LAAGLSWLELDIVHCIHCKLYSTILLVWYADAVIPFLANSVWYRPLLPGLAKLLQPNFYPISANWQQITLIEENGLFSVAFEQKRQNFVCRRFIFSSFDLFDRNFGHLAIVGTECNYCNTISCFALPTRDWDKKCGHTKTTTLPIVLNHVCSMSGVFEYSILYKRIFNIVIWPTHLS
jgi:hypothetical protein